MKVWVKTLLGEKIVKSYVYTPACYNEAEICEYVKFICNELDEPTPIFLQKHYSHLHQFHNTVFTSRDFVESVYFDSMHVQVYDEKDTKKKINPYYV